MRLTREDMKWAEEIANIRNNEAIEQGRKDTIDYTRGYHKDPLKCHIHGAAGELGACRIIGIDWDASHNIYHNEGSYDISALEAEVRTVTDPKYNLEVKWNDNLNQNFILVYCDPDNMSEVMFIGWIAKEDVAEALQNRSFTYGQQTFIKKEALNSSPMALLKKYFKGANNGNSR